MTNNQSFYNMLNLNNQHTDLEQKFQDMVTNRSMHIHPNKFVQTSKNNVPSQNTINNQDVFGFASKKKKVFPVVIAPSNAKNIEENNNIESGESKSKFTNVDNKTIEGDIFKLLGSAIGNIVNKVSDAVKNAKKEKLNNEYKDSTSLTPSPSLTPECILNTANKINMPEDTKSDQMWGLFANPDKLKKTDTKNLFVQNQKKIESPNSFKLNDTEDDNIEDTESTTKSTTCSECSDVSSTLVYDNHTKKMLIIGHMLNMMDKILDML